MNYKHSICIDGHASNWFDVLNTQFQKARCTISSVNHGEGLVKYDNIIIANV